MCVGLVQKCKGQGRMRMQECLFTKEREAALRDARHAPPFMIRFRAGLVSGVVSSLDVGHTPQC